MTTRLAAPLTAPPVTRPVIPRLLPEHLQRALPLPALTDIRRKLSQLMLYDALVYGRERVDYIEPCDGSSAQIRLYRCGRIIAIARVRGDNPDKVKSALVSVLFARGWSAEACELVEGAAYNRRRTRRALPKWC